MHCNPLDHTAHCNTLDYTKHCKHRPHSALPHTDYTTHCKTPDHTATHLGEVGVEKYFTQLSEGGRRSLVEECLALLHGELLDGQSAGVAIHAHVQDSHGDFAVLAQVPVLDLVEFLKSQLATPSSIRNKYTK